MLTDLHVRNIAIIDEISVSFKEGLNIITGETGAGKSLLVGAINLLLGERASPEMIRTGEETATIEACFDIRGNERVKEKLTELDIDADDELFIRRTMTRSGKSRVFINDSLVNLHTLSAIGELLINICSQREHQVILNRGNHLDILDEFGNLTTLRKEYKNIYQNYQDLLIRERELISLHERHKAEAELQQFQLREIENAALKEGEEEALLEEKKVLANFQKLRNLAELSYENLYNAEQSILVKLQEFINTIRDIKKLDTKVTIPLETLEETYYQLEDIALTLGSYLRSLSFDPERLETIEERLELLGKLKRKYGGTIEAVLRKRDSLREAAKQASHLAVDIEETQKALVKVKELLNERAIELSQRRKEAALTLASLINEELHTLKMERASFKVNITPPSQKEDFYLPTGIDEVEFFISTNPGEDYKPLLRIASGGELSRFILALKKVLAHVSSVSTVIFDEVDSGIGGATAEIVGEKLKSLSHHCQILCITHLPQIACFADHHFLVTKKDEEKQVKIHLTYLSPEERITEITRMLAGIELTQKAREHAREMLTAVLNQQKRLPKER